MAETQKMARLLDPQAYFTSPRESTLVEDVKKEMAEEEEGSVLDADQIREQEDWSFLASKIVGAEGD